jgi:hypothetical protein
MCIHTHYCSYSVAFTLYTRARGRFKVFSAFVLFAASAIVFFARNTRYVYTVYIVCIRRFGVIAELYCN